MYILVTGCSGFIGSHYCEKLLKKGYNIVGIDNFDPYYDKTIKIKNLQILNSYKNFKFEEIDIRKLSELKQPFSQIDISRVVHFAAKAGVRNSVEFPNEYAESNIIGSLNLLENCREFNVNSFDYAGSSSIYGNNEKIPFSEDSDTNKPESPYAATKKSVELFGYTYHSLYDINFTSFRFFSVYGPRGRPDMAVYKFTKNILDDNEVTIYGDGTYKRDFTYVTDIINGMFLAIDKKLGYQLFNLGNETPVSVNELLDYLEEIIGKKSKRRYMEPPKGEANLTFADISKARKLLGFNPKIDIKQGLTSFVEWFKKYM